MNIRSIRDPYLKNSVEKARENAQAAGIRVQMNLHGRVEQLPDEVAALVGEIVDELAANALHYVAENGLKGYEINILPNTQSAVAKGRPGLAVEVANPVRLRFDLQAIDEAAAIKPAASGLSRIRQSLEAFRLGQWRVGWKYACRRGSWFAGSADTTLHRDFFTVQLSVTGPKPKKKPPARAKAKKTAPGPVVPSPTPEQ